MLHWKRASGGNCQNKENTWVIQQYKYMEMSCLHTVFCVCLSVQYFLAALRYAVIFFWHNWKPFTSFVFKLEYSKYKVSVVAGELAVKVTGFCYFWMDWGEAMNSVACFIHLFIYFCINRCNARFKSITSGNIVTVYIFLWKYKLQMQSKLFSGLLPRFHLEHFTGWTCVLWIYFLKKLHISFLWQFI